MNILRRYAALFSGFVSAVLAVAFTMIFIWGETGGLYHAFKHYGVRDGLVAVFVPPYAWYRGLHFFYWLAQDDSGKIQTKKYPEHVELAPEEVKEFNLEDLMYILPLVLAPDLAPEDVKEFYLELKPEEQEEFNALLGKGVKDQLDDIEKKRLKTYMERLFNRLGLPTKEQKYPELTPEEKNELYAIIDKALEKPIYSNDLKRLKNCIEGYLNRTGLPLLYEDSEIKLFIEQRNIWAQYQYELGKCLLKSYDSKQPYVSDTLKELGEIMELIDAIYEGRLEDDFNKILSVANRTSYTDRFGRTRTLNREDIITGLDVMKMIEENFKKILKLCEEFEDQRK